ncbi:hypothetical protein BDY19DRAFT_1035787 [Irpex rosettiformis]|uniref:Uncharacterized protein n=1 Tax=Irpex rosettiformis TaxID=378272 RepID=A0ACB8TMK7_9APHY|nr:hypothetical protein BDY19DRAFT_1035787 [Irpex rosettiformis]
MSQLDESVPTAVVTSGQGTWMHTWWNILVVEGIELSGCVYPCLKLDPWSSSDTGSHSRRDEGTAYANEGEVIALGSIFTYYEHHVYDNASISIAVIRNTTLPFCQCDRFLRLGVSGVGFPNCFTGLLVRKHTGIPISMLVVFRTVPSCRLASKAVFNTIERACGVLPRINALALRLAVEVATHDQSLEVDAGDIDWWYTHQQVQDADEDWPTTFRKAVASIQTPSLKIDLGHWVLFDPSLRSSWPSPRSSWSSLRSSWLSRHDLDPRPAIGASTSTAPLWVKIVSDATTPGQQPYHHPILRTNPRPDPWSPASTRIPPELFDNILLYLSLDLDSNWMTGNRKRLLRVVKMCSLVCLRWANLCRQALFHDKQIKIRSSEEVKTFTKYATQGCPSLVPIHALIKSIRVEQRYNTRHSFCDRVYMLKTRFSVRLSSLKLTGPVPDGFPSCKLDTPHWSLPPSVPTPPSLLSYDRIRVEDVHLSSFRHVVKYVRHFAQAGSVEFNHLTWDTDGQEPQLPFYRRGSRKVEDKGLEVHAGSCTDNLLLCLLAVTVHSRWRSLLCMLPDDESQWITIMIRWSQDLQAENAQTSDVHVVGVTLGVGKAGEKVDVDSLRENLGHFPMLCAALLRFDSYKGLLAAMEHHRPLSFNPQPVNGQGCTYVFMCLRGPNDVDDDFPEVPRANRSWAHDDPFTSHDLGLLLTRESLRQTGNIPPAFT